MSAGQKPFTIRRWVLLTLLGWIVGIALIVLIAGLGEALKIGGDAQWIVGLGMALGVSCLQWVMLRKHLSRSSRWIWTTTVGMTMAWVIADTLRSFLHFRPDDQVLPTTIAGALLAGWLQWRFVTKGLGAKSIDWILITTIGWIFSALIIFPMPSVNKLHLPRLLSIFLAFATLFSGGIILGWITGKKMKSLLQ